MKNLMKILLITVSLSVLIISAGCRSKVDETLDSGNTKFINGDVIGASEEYLSVLKDDPYNEQATIKMASVGAYLRWDYEIFYKQIEKLSKRYNDFNDAANIIKDPNDNKRLAGIAKRNYEHVKSEIAADEIEFLTEAINKNPDNPFYYFVRGIWNLQFYNISKSINDFSSAINLNNKFMAAYFMRGLAYSQLGTNYEERTEFQNNLKAIYDFNRVISDDPENKAALNMISACYFNMQQMNESVFYMNKLYKLDTTDVEVLKLKAVRDAFVMTDWAIEDYKKLTKLDEKNEEYLFMLGRAELNGQHVKEGLADLKRALAICTNERFEKKVMKLMVEYDKLKDPKKEIERKKNDDKFINLYLAGKESLDKHEYKAAYDILKRADAICENNYYKRRIANLLKSDPNLRKLNNLEKKGSETSNLYISSDKNNYKELYRQGKEKIIAGKNKEGIAILRRALNICRDNEYRRKIVTMLESASSSADSPKRKK